MPTTKVCTKKTSVAALKQVVGFSGIGIINLPGSPKAVRENIEEVLPAIGHAIEKTKGSVM